MTGARVLSAERPGVDRCPGVLRLHAAQDGGLARIRLPGGRLDASQLAVIAAAGRLGNGLVEITSRANVQVRGLSDEAGERVAGLLMSAGMLPSPRHDRVRNIVASPLAASTDAAVAALDRGLCADPSLASLPGRFLFAVDDGAGLTPFDADVRLTAVGSDSFALGLAGARTTLFGGVDLALAAAREFLALGESAWRLREIEGGAAEVARRLGGGLAGDESGVVREPAPGSVAQADGRYAVTALPPLGRVELPALDALAGLVPEIRLSTHRTLTVLDVERSSVDGLLSALAELGFVVAPESGWERLSACAGIGLCGKAKVDVRAAAAERAPAREPGAPAEHWSGCDRRCGEPADAVAVFADEDGLVVERDGSRLSAPSVEEAMSRL